MVQETVLTIANPVAFLATGYTRTGGGCNSVDGVSQMIFGAHSKGHPVAEAAGFVLLIFFKWVVLPPTRFLRPGRVAFELVPLIFLVFGGLTPGA